MGRVSRNELAEAAKVEKVRREKARRSLLVFCKYILRAYPAHAPHLKLLTDELEQVERFVASGGQDGTGRLMVFMPPRYWKSQTATTLFPSWLLGREPEKRIIVTSYAGNLAFKFSRRARDIVRSDEYGKVFGQQSAVDQPVELDRDSQSVQAWDLAGHAGGMTAAGVGGGITGTGAHLLIIDDPVKDREQAESESYRERAWDWYTSTAYTRLEDGGAVVLIMTRWHVDDLAGRLLKQMRDEPGAEQWRVVMLPALAEEYSDEDREKEPWLPAEDQLGRSEGEPLWPQKHGHEALRQIEVTVGPYDWPSLYQQWPRPKEGRMFKRAWFRLEDVGQVPQGLTWVRYWDLAQVSDEEAKRERKDPSYTCSVATALGPDGTVYYRDMIRGRMEWPDAQQVVKATMLVEGGHVRNGIEAKLHGKTAVQEMLRDPELVGVPFEAVNVEGGAKETRALALQTRAHAGKVVLVRTPTVMGQVLAWLRSRGKDTAADGLESGAWTGGFLDEVCDFPSGKHDDQVDTAVGGSQMLGVRNEAVVERVTGDVARVLSDWRG